MILPSIFLLIGLAAVVVDALRPSSGTTAGRLAAGMVRAGVFALLALALTQPQCVFRASGGRRIWVVDTSKSMSDAQLSEARRIIEAEHQRAPSADGLVLVGLDPTIAIHPGSPWVWPDRPAVGSGTDIGLGLQAAIGLIDAGAGGRIALITDGRDTAENWPDAVSAAWRLGIPIDVIPLPPPADAIPLKRVTAKPEVVRPGGTVSIEVELDPGDASVGGSLTIATEQAEDQRRGIALDKPGVEVFEIPLPPDAAPGARSARVTWRSDGQERTLEANFTVGPPPAVLLVSDTAAELEPFGAALQADGMNTRHIAPSDLDRASLAVADLVVLGDVSATDEPGRPGVPTAWQAALRRWVGAGGGLVTFGGDQTYDLGGWSGTPLGDVVPLDLAPKSEDVEPAVALVHVLDTSASMGDWTGRHTKMALANEAAVASIRLVRPKDRVAVLGVSDLVRRVVPLGPVDDNLRVIASVRGIKPGGGGIYVYTALAAAADALKTADTPQKHVVLYCDAKDAEEKVQGYAFDVGPGPTAQGVASALRQSGATLSVIALGDPRDQDVGFLRDLARIGGGRFHLAMDPNELRAIFIEETRQVVKSIVHDERFRARSLRPAAATEGVDFARGPDFLGYTEVQPRDTASVLVEDPQGRAVLTTWQYGLGQVFSWNTDLGTRWGRLWVADEQYPRLAVQLARAALRPPLARGADIEARPAHRGMTVTVRPADEEGNPRLEAQPSLVWRAGATRTPVLPVPLGEGTWRANIVADPGTPGILDVLDPNGDVVASQDLVVPRSPEEEVPPMDLQQIAGSTEGFVDQLGPMPPGRGRPWPLGPWLLGLAAILLPVDAWLRRGQRVA